MFTSHPSPTRSPLPCPASALRASAAWAVRFVWGTARGPAVLSLYPAGTRWPTLYASGTPLTYFDHPLVQLLLPVPVAPFCLLSAVVAK